MIQKYVYGKPFTTEAVVKEVAVAAGTPAYGSIETEHGFRFTYKMEENDIVYGLGEANRGQNAIPVTVRMIRTTRKTSVLYMVRITLLSWQAGRHSDCFSIIRQRSLLISDTRRQIHYRCHVKMRT